MELLTVKWQNLDKAKRKLHVPLTNNGKSREVYLSDDTGGFVKTNINVF